MDVDRVESLLGRLTLEEKVAMVSGSNMFHSTGIPRLGIPRFKMSDGPIGARGDMRKGKTSACFPAAVALAATWDPARVAEVGAALADEVRAKGAHVLLAPTINLQRTPLGGRDFECYSEDPWLTAAVATGYVRGLQGRGIGACLKHFVCNESEYQRRTMSSEVAERPLRELYLRPFELVVQDAEPWCVMSSYNRVNGEWASSHRGLLRDILKEEWGFGGVVVSDWGAAQDAVKDANAGLDLEMPGPSLRMGEKLLAAVRAGDVAEKELDDKVRRLLRLLERAGRFEHPEEVEERAEDRPEHRALARRVAGEAMVLLRNEAVLPLDPQRLRRVAVIGPNAALAQIMGGGSAAVFPHYQVNPLEALRERLGPDVEVVHELGCRIPKFALPFAAGTLHTEAGAAGLDVEYWNAESFEGAAAARAVVAQTSFFFGGTAPAEGVERERYAVRYRARWVPESSGLHEFGLLATGPSRLRVDGREIIDNWSAPTWLEDMFGSRTSREKRGALHVEAGRSYDLQVEYVRRRGYRVATLRFGVLAPEPGGQLERAVSAAAAADAAILVVGTSGEWETEGSDRESMDLPGAQDELIERVSAAQPRTVVVVNAGSAVSMPWAERAPAILCAWFPGQEFGNALADVLFGEVNPAGRLPHTIPQRIEDTPAFTSYPGEHGQVAYAEGLFAGYRWYDARKIAPRFAFGHGLSYTRFRYGALRAAARHALGAVLEVTCEITNEGERAGAEVAQLYLRDRHSPVVRPVQELRAFAKLFLQPGETGIARFALDDRAFAYWDPTARAWRIEPGAFELAVGASSRDLRGQAIVHVERRG